MRVLLVGFGAVGRGFTAILNEKAAHLHKRSGTLPIITGIITRTQGSLYHPGGLSTDVLRGLDRLEAYPDEDGLVRGWDAQRMIAHGEADVVIEATPTDLETGEPALSHVRTALTSGKDVVLANKGPVALAYADIQALAREHGRRIRYEATVMAGTPVLATAQEALAACTITSLQGILNGTTNDMLSQMEQGATYAQALAQAQAAGYAEADPTADVGGWDAAGKLLILANAVLGLSLSLADLDVTGITDLSAEAIQQARDQNMRYKLLAQITPQGGSVRPVRLPLTDPLASVMGTTNAITMATDLLGDVTLIGAGAGGRETGAAVLADVLALVRCWSLAN